MKRAAALCAALLLIPQAAAALSLAEAVRLALENNHLIREARFGEEAAAAVAGASRSGFLPSLDVGYRYTMSDQERFFPGPDASAFTVELSYNIFKGKSDSFDVAEADARGEAARYRRRSVEADTVLDVKWAYIDVLSALRAVETAAEGVALLEEQRREGETFFRQGLTAKNDLLRIEVELSSARQALLKAEGDARLARRALVRLMGVEIADGESVDPFAGLPDPGKLDGAALTKEMLESRSELKYLRSLQAALEADREARKGTSWPRVDVVLSHENYGDSPFPGGQEGGFDADNSAMLTATWNLFDGRRSRHRVREADSLAKANAEALRDTEAELVLQLETALERYRVARSSVATAGTAVEQAEENYRVNESLFRQRLATTTDLVDARYFLTRARNEHSDVIAEIHKSLAGLERVLERPLTGERADASPGSGRPAGER